MAVLAGHDLDGRDALLLGLMGEHPPPDRIPDGVHVPDAGVVALIHLDDAPFELDPGLLEPHPFGIRAAAHGDEDVVGFDRVRPLDGYRHLVALPLRAGDLRARADLKALLTEDARSLLHDLRVHPRQDRRHRLEHGDARAEA